MSVTEREIKELGLNLSSKIALKELKKII